MNVQGWLGVLFRGMLPAEVRLGLLGKMLNGSEPALVIFS